MTHRLTIARLTAIALGAALAIPAAAFAAEPVAAASAAAGKNPKDVCGAMVEAAKKDDFKTFQNLSWEWTMGGHHGEKAEKAEKKEERGFHEMHAQEMGRLKDLKCGDEHVAGNAAIVETETQGEKRLIPFLQREGTWKFDPRTYMSFYRDSMHETAHDPKAKGKSKS